VAAQRGTYVHCLYNGDDLVKETSFPEMDFYLGPPNGSAAETGAGSHIFRRHFASGTVAEWNNNTGKGTITWGRTPAPPAPPAHCGTVMQNTGLRSHDLDRTTTTASLGECCSRCRAEKRCVGYAWHNEEKNACHLHSEGAKGSPGVAGCFSAFLNTSVIADN
jgi:hypothetical protein